MSREWARAQRTRIDIILYKAEQRQKGRGLPVGSVTFGYSDGDAEVGSLAMAEPVPATDLLKTFNKNVEMNQEKLQTARKIALARAERRIHGILQTAVADCKMMADVCYNGHHLTGAECTTIDGAVHEELTDRLQKLGYKVVPRTIGSTIAGFRVSLK